MKNLKFRVWDVQDKKMYTVEEINLNSQTAYVEHKKVYYSNDQLMQYTDMLDSEGKGIWEGDILKYIQDEKAKFSVCEFQCGSFECFPYYLSSEDFKIVGNIYENPELLK